MMEWVIIYGRDSAARKDIRGVTGITHLNFSAKGEKPSKTFEPLLSGFLWFADGSGISDTTKILMQGFRDKV